MRLPRTRRRATRRMSVGAKRTPSSSATTRKPTALTRISATDPGDTVPVCATAVTVARMTRPSTSSMIAAPSTTRAAGCWSRSRSASTRAVIPTLVAVSVAPTKIAAVVEKPHHAAKR